MAAVAGSSRGGRGGGRGRGRGGGGGGGGRGGALNALQMGMLSWGDVMQIEKQSSTGALRYQTYPAMEGMPSLSRASEEEQDVVRSQISFLQTQRETLWWPVNGNELLVSSASAATSTSAADGADAVAKSSAPANSALSIKRGSAHIARYSDKFRRPRDVAASAINNNHAPSSTSSLMDSLQRQAFPAGLWRAYVEGESKRQERRQEAAHAASTKRRGDWQRIMEGVELTGADDAVSEGHAPSEEEEQVDVDEYEDDVEDDYADNYFDNGEDDDIGDDGGGGGGEGEDVYD